MWTPDAIGNIKPSTWLRDFIFLYGSFSASRVSKTLCFICMCFLSPQLKILLQSFSLQLVRSYYLEKKGRRRVCICQSHCSPRSKRRKEEERNKGLRGKILLYWWKGRERGKCIERKKEIMFIALFIFKSSLPQSQSPKLDGPTALRRERHIVVRPAFLACGGNCMAFVLCCRSKNMPHFTMSLYGDLRTSPWRIIISFAATANGLRGIGIHGP